MAVLAEPHGAEGSGRFRSALESAAEIIILGHIGLAEDVKSCDAHPDGIHVQIRWLRWGRVAMAPDDYSAIAVGSATEGTVTDGHPSMILEMALVRELPALDDFRQIVRLIQVRPPLYIRYSEGPEWDREGPSRDYESGLILSGLSVTSLNPPAWWTRPVEIWVARRMCRYEHLMQSLRRPRPWLLTGRVVDVGPDHEPLIVEASPIAWVGQSALAEARRIYHQNLFVAQDSRSLPARITELVPRFAVVMEAYVTGTSTRKAGDLVAAMGAESGISESAVRRACADLDIEVAAFRDRSLAHIAFPYVFVDATFCKARTGGDRRGRGSRVTAQAVVIATGISVSGRREVVGFDVGDSESGAFWTAFLRSLRARGLHGVQLVTSDAHTGLKAAIGSILLGTAWQRCRQHFARNLVAMVPRGHADVVAAALRTIFAQSDAAGVRAQLDVIAGMLGRQFPKVEAKLRQAGDEITAFADFPAEHWKKVWSTTGLERANKEIKRRTDVVGVFPDPPSLLRFAGIVLAGIHDEWQVSDRRIFSEASMAKLLEPEVGHATTGEHRAVAIPAAIAP